MLIKKIGTKAKKYYLKYEEFKKLNLDDVPDCSTAYIKDWYRLDSSTKAELGDSNFQMFDAAERIWMPQ